MQCQTHPAQYKKLFLTEKLKTFLAIQITCTKQNIFRKTLRECNDSETFLLLKCFQNIYKFPRHLPIPEYEGVASSLEAPPTNFPNMSWFPKPLSSSRFLNHRGYQSNDKNFHENCYPKINGWRSLFVKKKNVSVFLIITCSKKTPVTDLRNLKFSYLGDACVTLQICKVFSFTLLISSNW